MIRTILFFAGWIIFTLVAGTLCLPALATQRSTWAFSRFWAGGTLHWLRITTGIRSEIRGLENRPARGSMVASKHQSAWDTLMMWKMVDRPTFVLKRELYLIPIFGWYLWRGGNIGIDRNAKREAMRTIMSRARELAAQGRSIVIFPEGTRMRRGQEKPFHAGVARISRELNLPVTPVALNAGSFWPKHTLRKTAGTAVMEFLPAMAPAQDAEWLANLQHAINAKTAELENA